MIDWIIKGGSLMGLLFIASLIAVAVIIERFNYYRRIESKHNKFLKELYDNLSVYQTEAAEVLCRQNPGPLSEIALAGLAAWDRERDELKEILIEAGNRQIPKLEANLWILSTVAHTSPLLGLLGTVLGLVQSFQHYDQVAQSGQLPGPGLLAGGIWTALITTVGGLTIAIPTLIVHNYLYIKKERMINSLEESSQEILEILMEKRHGAVR